MGNTRDSLRKQREIAFCTLHSDQDQGRTAAAMLTDLEQIEQVARENAALISVVYRVDQVRLIDIEELLEKRGFHLDNSLLSRLRSALVHYMEDTERTNMGCSHNDPNCATKAFASAYRRRDHGCQDERPKHWRRYL